MVARVNGLQNATMPASHLQSPTKANRSMSAKCFTSNLMSSHSAPSVQPWKLHLYQYPNFALLFDEPFHCRHEVLVVLLRQFATELDQQVFATCFFLEIDGHDSPLSKR